MLIKITQDCQGKMVSKMQLELERKDSTMVGLLIQSNESHVKFLAL